MAVEVASKKKFAPLSRVKIKWAINMYAQWRVNRINNRFAPDEIVKSNLDIIMDLKNSDLCFLHCHGLFVNLRNWME